MDGCLLSHQGIVAELSNGVRLRSGRGVRCLMHNFTIPLFTLSNKSNP